MEKEVRSSFGISWIKHSKHLGYHFGYELNDDFIGTLQSFIKHIICGNLDRFRSKVLNSACVTKIVYYVTCGLMPRHYLKIFQRSMFRFVWSSAFEPICRKTLHLPFIEGGINIPNIDLKIRSLYLVHLTKLLQGHNAVWTYFAKYWLAIPLRKYNQSIYGNNFPHSEVIPTFYRKCLEVLKHAKSTDENIDITLPYKASKFYMSLLKAERHKPNCIGSQKI